MLSIIHRIINSLTNNKSNNSGDNTDLSHPDKNDILINNGMNHIFNHYNTEQKDVNPEEAEIAGVDPKDSIAMENLKRKLTEWDYTVPASAKAAYTDYGVERIQFLRQIKGQLKEGLGVGSALYDKLYDAKEGTTKWEPAIKARKKAASEGRRLQPWHGMINSVRFREFVKEHQDFLGGYVGDDDLKWHFSQSSNIKENLPHISKIQNDTTHEARTPEKTAKPEPMLADATIEQKYSPDVTYQLGSTITHPALGTGKVIEYIQPNKMDVDFGGEIKRLVCGRLHTNQAASDLLPHNQQREVKKFHEVRPFKENAKPEPVINSAAIEQKHSPVSTFSFNSAAWPWYETVKRHREILIEPPLERQPSMPQTISKPPIKKTDKLEEELPMEPLIENQPAMAHTTPQAAGGLPLGQIVSPSTEETAKSGPEFDSETNEQLTKILSSHFSNGYRISSSIDFERFKHFYASQYGAEFTYGADKFDLFVYSAAVIFDDRAYVYGDEVVDAIRIYLEKMESPCISINIFFEKHSQELFEFGIFSIDILKAFIKKNYSGISCKSNYIYLQPDVSTASLIREVFNEREIWSYDELKERLPSINMDTIRQTLNRMDYVRVGTSVYTHIDKMDLPDSEGEKIFAFVSEKLQAKDYVIANELDLSKFASTNPHCPFLAIRDAVFHKFLSNRFDKRGQVITHKGAKLRVQDILEQYCREAESVSLDELNKFEAMFAPEGTVYSYCLTAAHSIMVRVSDALFVAGSKVSFDVAKIDEILSGYCREDFIPLKSVVDFSLFPYPGYQWNQFLLESYVRKYSRLFKYADRAANNANIGVIIKDSFVYSEYDDILAIALAKSPLSLGNTGEVGDYLIDNGYIGRRNLGNSEEQILTRAKKLREEGAV
jgi:hypothetical protein